MYGSRVAEIRCEYERICECAEVARTNSVMGEHQKMKPSRNERRTRPLDGQGASFDTKTLDEAYPPVCAQLLARRLWSDLHRRKKLPASIYTLHTSLGRGHLLRVNYATEEAYMVVVMDVGAICKAPLLPLRHGLCLVTRSCSDDGLLSRCDRCSIMILQHTAWNCV